MVATAAASPFMVVPSNDIAIKNNGSPSFPEGYSAD
jgi:hypothetical protein